MRRLLLSAVATLALGGVALAQTSAPSTAPAPIVHIKNLAYTPDTLTVAAGQTVRFIQDDETPHTVTATDKSFDSAGLTQGANWTYTFAKAGTYTYVCTYHSSMKGTIVVK
jgi:plastocyanin